MSTTTEIIVRDENARQAPIRIRREILLRQLRIKFKKVPEGIVQRIEAAESITDLDYWLGEVVLAKKLEDVGIPPEEEDLEPMPPEMLAWIEKFLRAVETSERRRAIADPGTVKPT